jgi:hypothetical protein
MGHAAANYRDGDADGFDTISGYIGSDLACTVEVERLRSKAFGLVSSISFATCTRRPVADVRTAIRSYSSGPLADAAPGHRELLRRAPGRYESSGFRYEVRLEGPAKLRKVRTSTTIPSVSALHTRLGVSVREYRELEAGTLVAGAEPLDVQVRRCR